MPGFELIGKEELAEISKMFEIGKGNLYRYGPSNHAVRELEMRFAEYMGVKFAHAVSSGTAAIHSALGALDIGPGDEVITTAFTFVAPVEAICALGAIPVPVEIDETYHLDPLEVEKAVTRMTKAVVCIPMWAAPQMDDLMAVCERRNLLLIEDAAQCLGGLYKGKKLGKFGKIGAFSFDMGKSITTGEGGMVITDDEDLYNRVAEFSDHGHMHVKDLPRGLDPRRKRGLNYRMNELAGAVGLAQLAKLDGILEKQKENKKKIKEQIKDVTGLTFREFSDEKGSQGDTLILRLPSKEKAAMLALNLESKGFGTKILPEAFEWHYAGSWAHIFKDYPGYDLENLKNHWPKTRSLLESSVALPIFVNMSDNTIDRMIKSVRTCASEIGL
ncbi:MAG: DegT/DnrJ/EryC1/StrS family aminotransferase [Deltaproteobacteria bacterium]|nr:DegT/DnrJ/EryC1/StrS family aminotransferase [Deltaproteobacteria bacterium]